MSPKLYPGLKGPAIALSVIVTVSGAGPELGCAPAVPAGVHVAEPFAVFQLHPRSASVWSETAPAKSHESWTELAQVLLVPTNACHPLSHVRGMLKPS